MESPTRLRLAIAGLAALAVTTTPVVLAQAETGGGSRYQATITRTEYGIPHVSAKDIPSAGFGYGYAFAQDNICTLADTMLTLRGERSRYLGPDGVADTGLNSWSNLDSDVCYRSANSSGKIQSILAGKGKLAPSARARTLVAGYAAGVNRYLAKTGAERIPDPTCRGRAWVRPVTELDIWRNVHDVNQIGGTGALLDQIATAKPSTAATKASTPVKVAKPEYGSNGWGLGSQSTRNGRGMLLGNPHFPWHGGKRFYQVQLTVPGELNVSGGSVYGTPTVAIGFNQNLAWSHTVSTAQRFTMFQLRLAGGDPTR